MLKILIGEDDAVSRRILHSFLTRWGFDVVAAADGWEAWQAMEGRDAPSLAILDWVMPGLDGLEVCRRIRARQPTGRLSFVYVILLTSKGNKDDVVRGLDAGADDYVTKPFDREELRARVQVGARMIQLQNNLAKRVRDLGEARARVKQLQGLLPICSYCKKIRSDGNYWEQVETYIADHSEAQFSHGICPDCYDAFVRPALAKLCPGPESKS